MNKLRIAVSALVVTAAAMAASLSSPASEPVLLLEPTPAYTFAEWTRAMSARGVRMDHIFPPAGGLLILRDGATVESIAEAVPPGTLVFEWSPDGVEAARLQSTLEGRMVWHAHRALLGLEETEPATGTPHGRPLVDDALEPPEAGPEVGCTAYALYRTTSEYMLGSASVTVILPESTGGASTEDWTGTMETNVSNEIVQGLNDLITLYNGFGLSSSLRPSWTYHYIFGRTDSRAQVTVEPISNPGPTGGNPQWVNTIYDNLGYGSDTNMFDKGRHFNGDQRAGDGTDWALTVWVANSLNDADGMFSDGRFGYAYLGGPFFVMTYDNDGWGITQMNNVTRHETCHIFYALDEYASSGCYCSQSSGYVPYLNQNCENSCPSNVSCVMRNNTAAMCPYTRGTIGWGDPDADGIGEPVDIDPETQLTAYSPDPTSNTSLTYTGTASVQAKTNQNIYHYQCDMNILTIANVQWRVDGGIWQNATASDGAFDSGSESYFFNASVAPGTHLFETRAVDAVGQTDATPASDTVTVSGCTDAYEPNETCATAYSLSCGSTINPMICTASDVDYFSVVPPSMGTLTVSMMPAAGKDYDLEVQSADCLTVLCAPAIRGSGVETCNVSVIGGTTYKIRVVGYSGAFDTVNAYQLAIGCQACSVPPCSTNPSPADSATGVPLATTLAWATASGATSYDVYFGTSSPPTYVTNTSATTFAPGALSAGTQYFWKIVPINACGPAAGCAIWSFTTCTAPSCASGPSPADSSTGVGLSINLSWTASVGATSYDVYFGNSPSPPFAASTVSTSYSPGTLAANTIYFWQIVPKNTCGSAAGCAVWSFTTCTPPPCATGPSPADSASGVALTPTLTWSPSSGATSYDVYFGTASPPPYAGNVTMPPYSPGTLSYATTYHWRVVPKNACGSASGCATWSFTTLPMPPSVTLVKKVGNPFRIKVYGSNLQDGLRVYISGSLWGDTTDPSLVKWKNDGLIVIKKGGALKALFPQGTFVPIRIVNPDGGEITVAFDRQSKTWTTLP